MVSNSFMKTTTRRTFLQLAQSGAALSALMPRIDAARNTSPNTLWYEQPARKWEEALAIGNGRLGAMIFGGVEKEKLQLNEITIWSGQLERHADRTDAYTHLPEIRGLIQDGKYADAAKLMTAHMTCAIAQD